MRTSFSTSERRTFGRKQLLKVGVVSIDAGKTTLPCVVRDLSDRGASLQLQNPVALPERFELFVELDGIKAQCQVIRRQADGLGVRFLAAPAATKLPEINQATPVEAPAKPTAGTLEALYAAEAAVRAKRKSIPIVIADDDPDDRLLIEEAFLETRFIHPFSFVTDGEELLKYLRGVAPFEGRQQPGLVLLDLNMPRMDGRTALMHIRTDKLLRGTPVVVFTTSDSEEDIQRTYELGVSGYVPKPNSQDGLLDVVNTLDSYWMRMAIPGARIEAIA